jgi:hypothetical protein
MIQILRHSSVEMEGSRKFTGSAGLMLLEAVAYNNTGGDLYLEVFDQAAALADGALPVLVAGKVPAGSTASVSFAHGLPLNFDVQVGLSTGAGAYVGSGVAAGWFCMTAGR